ncbi:unnamed protein product [Prorocentrum cordatum]|uniref:Sel1 repeat family protein n=1 Tax=Prorocentrum cordatum TaxID=2364126 RepID=A0ABN9VZL0_9DINO|nr:unnamed protein product [Polarella glacialis]
MTAARRRCRSIGLALVAMTASIGLWQVADVAFGIFVRGRHFSKHPPVASHISSRLQRFVTRASADDLYQEAVALMDQGRAPQEKILEGIQKVTQAGMDGSRIAQSTLGIWYWQGSVGLPEDKTLAIQWWEKAAAQGDPGANFNLGWAKLHGMGLPQNKFEAAKSFRAAAEQGHTQGMTYLAQMLHRGDGIPQDSLLAAEWMIKAATSQGQDLTEIMQKFESNELTPEQRIQLSDKIYDLQMKNREKSVIVSKDTSKPVDEWDDERGQV